MGEKKFSKLIVKIHTKAFDADSIMKTAQPVIDFANQHDIALRLERDSWLICQFSSLSFPKNRT